MRDNSQLCDKFVININCVTKLRQVDNMLNKEIISSTKHMIGFVKNQTELMNFKITLIMFEDIFVHVDSQDVGNPYLDRILSASGCSSQGAKYVSVSELTIENKRIEWHRHNYSGNDDESSLLRHLCGLHWNRRQFWSFRTHISLGHKVRITWVYVP